MTQILSPRSSEPSEGVGYWQASDGEWYPPAGGAPPTPKPRKRSFPRSAKITAVAAAAFVLFAVGVAAGQSDHTKLDAANKQSVALQGKLTTTQSQLADMRGQLTTVQGNQTALQASVTSQKAQLDARATQLDQQAATQKATLDQLAAAQKATIDQQAAAQTTALAQQKAALDQRSQQLDAQAAQLAARTAAADASTFSDGLYQVGADIKAGRYHTAGAVGCYWAKLGSSDTNNITDNSLTAGPQTVVISSPYFESNGCGTWTKVG